jgi:hypothetical protein
MSSILSLIPSTFLMIMVLGAYLYGLFRLFSWIVNRCKKMYISRLKIALEERIKTNLNHLSSIFETLSLEAKISLNNINFILDKPQVSKIDMSNVITQLTWWIERENCLEYEEVLATLIFDFQSLKDISDDHSQSF